MEEPRPTFSSQPHGPKKRASDRVGEGELAAGEVKYKLPK